MKTHLTVVLSFLLFSTYSFSQLVTPSDRVTSRLNVRDQPSGTVIGSMQPAETAPLITDTVSYWYMISYDADTGYVHKSWSEVIPAVTMTGKDELVIASWNIKWFGYYDDDLHDYTAMAELIRDFDVLAVQELRGDECAERLEALKSELNAGGYQYEYIWSDSTGYFNNPDTTKEKYIEHFACFWDTERIDLVNPSQPWEFIDLPAINNPHFRQVPMVADFKVKGDDGFDFKVVTVHTVYNEAMNDVRRSEIRFLHDWMNASLRDISAAEKDIFIIGDFNANPDGQPAHFDDIITDTAMYRVVFNEPLLVGEDSKRTTILVKSNIEPEDHLLPAYDHLLMSKHTTYAFPIYPITWASGIIGVVEFDQDERWEGMSRNDIQRAMSDHRPIWIKIPYDTEDRD